MSPGSPDEGAWADEHTHDPAASSSHEVPGRWLGPDTPDGKVCGCKPGVPLTPLMSAAPTATARGRCLIRRRPLMTLPPRQLAGPGAIVGRLTAPRSGMGLCPTRCSRSVGTVAPAECSAPAPLGRDRTGAFRLLALVTRLGVTLRPLRTGGAPAPRRGPSGLPVGFRTSARRPMVLSLPLTAISSRGTFMRPSTRCGVCARATPLGWGTTTGTWCGGPLSTAPVSAVARGATGSTGLSGRRVSSTTLARGTSLVSALRTPSGPRDTLMTLRSSTTRIRSASCSVHFSSAGTHALSSPPPP